MNHVTHIKARRISDFFGSVVKPGSPPRDKAESERRVRAGIADREHHVCEYAEPGVCEDCERVRKPKRGTRRWERIMALRTQRQAKINGAGEETP